MNDNDIVIVAAKRTPHGNMMGGLSALTASDLGAIANKATIAACELDPSSIDEVITGCVLQAGQGQAPGRQAALKAELPNSVPVTTINKMCGSGMKAVMLGHDLIKAGSIEVALCGGIESMSQAPYLLPKGRQGYRLGHDKIYDHMFLDGLEDAYNKEQLMGVFAERTAEEYQFSREAQDEFAMSSLKRALSAQEQNLFADEIAAVTVITRKGEITIDQDEGPDASKLEKISRLKPAFKKDGSVTAANSSSISDGASSLIICSAKKAQQLGLKPLARIAAHASFAHEPEWFTTAPVQAIKKVLQNAQWDQSSVDLFEINEAFAVVTMAAMHDLAIPHEKVNVKGGACALGHPIGASGARIIITLLHALTAGQKGVAALCIGGGEATAIAIEKLA
jgi:acetyl-CoA C-acetyltransferase